MQDLFFIPARHVISCMIVLILSCSNIDVSYAQSAEERRSLRIEKAKKVGKMRQKCRILSNQLAPKLTSTQFMQNSQPQNEAYNKKRKTTFLQCLKLSKLATNYTPDLVTLQNSLPQYRKTNASKAKKQHAQTALTIKVNQQNAKISILNIKPAYKNKMLVRSGLYHIRVEKEGFARWDQWLKVKGKKFSYTVKLKALTASQAAQSNTATQATTGQQAKKVGTTFKYAKRRANPATKKKKAQTNLLAKASQIAAQKRADRVALIKAKVAAKKEAQRLALIQKQHPLGTSSTPPRNTTRVQDAKFLAQVKINKAKLERGRRILAAQRKLSAQTQPTP